jgi:hypothetical protein
VLSEVNGNPITYKEIITVQTFEELIKDLELVNDSTTFLIYNKL